MIVQRIFFIFYVKIEFSFFSACKINDVMTVKQVATSDNVNVAGWLGWAPVHKGFLFRLFNYIFVN